MATSKRRGGVVLRTGRHVLVNVKHLSERFPYMRPTFSGRTQRSGTRRRVDCTVHGEPCAPEHNDRHCDGQPDACGRFARDGDTM